MSHSPFPWSEGESFLFDAGGQAICREYSHNLNWKDDRALIAAIPEMVAVLERMVLVFQPFTSRHVGAPNSLARLEQEEQKSAHHAARAVLQKVKT